MKPIGVYKNGNYTVIMFNDGTKIRETKEDEFLPRFAENCDVKITDKCDGGCPWCYEGCTANGRHGDILSPKFLDTLHPYTELAINGNDLTHPDLDTFLEKLKEKKIFTNMTVNQRHFELNYSRIKNWIDNKLIYGLGISLVTPTEDFIAKVKSLDNVVIHTINGVTTKEDYLKLSNHNLKILILGYKSIRRGESYKKSYLVPICDNQKWLYDNLEDLKSKFEIISFDNLAIKQLETKRLFPKEEDWEKFYMGDDGDFTFYIDLVKGTFAQNSLSLTRYPIKDSVDEMFLKIKAEKN